jgi:hypothetical protein
MNILCYLPQQADGQEDLLEEVEAAEEDRPWRQAAAEGVVVVEEASRSRSMFWVAWDGVVEVVWRMNKR